MVIKLFGKYWFFYRHMLYGSALVIGTVIGTKGYLNHIMAYVFLTAGIILMISSIFTSFVITMYPDEFERELKNRDEQNESNF